MKQWLYRWLPIIFGCHCRADRSFHFRGEPFPICARCTGELAGILTGIPMFLFFRLNPWVAAGLLVPMVVDGFVQLLTRYESTNTRRFATGFLFGVGLYTLFAYSVLAAFWFGYGLMQ